MIWSLEGCAGKVRSPKKRQVARRPSLFLTPRLPLDLGIAAGRVPLSVSESSFKKWFKHADKHTDTVVGRAKGPGCGLAAVPSAENGPSWEAARGHHRKARPTATFCGSLHTFRAQEGGLPPVRTTSAAHGRSLPPSPATTKAFCVRAVNCAALVALERYLVLAGRCHLSVSHVPQCKNCFKPEQRAGNSWPVTRSSLFVFALCILRSQHVGLLFSF